MTLFLYLAKRFTLTFGYIFLGFSLFYMLLDSIEVARITSRYDLELLRIFTISALRLPKGMYEILPLIVIIASLTMFLGLSRSSELVAVRASGRSALRMLLGPLSAALFVGALTLGILNPIATATSQRAETIINEVRGRGPSALSVGQDGLWLRQGDENSHVVIQARGADESGTEFRDVTFYSYDEDGRPDTRIHADQATLGVENWTLTNATKWDLSDSKALSATPTVHQILEFPTSLTVEQIRDGFGAPSTISIWELPAFISTLKLNGFSARRHSVHLHTELAQPLMLAGMVLIGAAFAMRHGRFGQTGSRVLMAIVLGFGFYFVRNLAIVLGENGQLPILLSAWLPPFAPILFSLGVILHLEDG